MSLIALRLVFHGGFLFYRRKHVCLIPCYGLRTGTNAAFTAPSYGCHRIWLCRNLMAGCIDDFVLGDTVKTPNQLMKAPHG